MIKLKHIVILTSLIIAGCAAFFSVYGIGLLFSGALLSTTIMASSLELGKLVSASWLFNNWKIANKLMKTYLILAILVLMGITSVGIFGYLTAAHQKSALESELAENKIKGLTEQKATEILNIEAVNKNIDRYIELRKAQEDRLATSITVFVIEVASLSSCAFLISMYLSIFLLTASIFDNSVDFCSVKLAILVSANSASNADF